VADVKESTEKARSLVTKPFEEAESSAGGSEGERSTVARTLMVAGAAAVAGGLAGAAQDWLSRRETSEAEGDEPEARADGAEDEPKEDEEPLDSADEEDDEPSGSAPQPEDEDEPRGEEPQDAAEPQDDDEDEPRAEEPEDEEEPKAADPQDEEEDELRAEEPQDDDQEADEKPEGGDEDGPRDEHGDDEARDGHGDGGAGAPLGRVGKLVRGAAQQLEQLVGAEAEGVSAMRRADDGWVMTLEVVEVRRVPNSTDVLASYEVRVDDDGEIVDFERGRRYRRGQVDED
jgi:hypothetical protein